MADDTPGTLRPGEPHPMAFAAKAWIERLGPAELLIWAEALASTALSDNRPAEICHETLHRLLNSEPVSDRYILGLAWMLHEKEEENA